MMRLLDDQESGLDAVISDAVPHHARPPHGDGMLELHFLAGVQRGVGVFGAETAVAVIQQLAVDFLRRRIVKGKLQCAMAGMASFRAAILRAWHADGGRALGSAGLPHRLPSVKFQFPAERAA